MVPVAGRPHSISLRCPMEVGNTEVGELGSPVVVEIARIQLVMRAVAEEIIGSTRTVLSMMIRSRMPTIQGVIGLGGEQASDLSNTFRIG